MARSDDFLSWALDPARTNDELYTIELMADAAWPAWCQRHGRSHPWDWDAILAHQQEQRLNPAYRAVIPREKLEALAEIWSEPVNSFSAGGYSQRPVTDLTALRFFPRIRSLDLRCRLKSIAPLTVCRELHTLSLHEDELSEIADFAPLAELPALATLRLTLQMPWPDLSALSALPKLTELTYRGNALALRAVARLDGVRTVAIESANGWETPLRDLRELPEMPRIRHLKVKPVAYLDGIERFAACNLQLDGPFVDLAPLAGCTSVTWLRLEGERFSDLQPVARMPALRELRLDRERPLDVTPLAEAPALRQAVIPRCPIVATELASINALLPPWAEDFLAPEPRPLRPLRFFSHRFRGTDWDSRRKTVDPRPAFYGDDRAYAAAESRWFVRELNRRIDRLLPSGWRETGDDHEQAYWSSHDVPGHHTVTLKRPEDALRLREVVALARELLAATRFPWLLTFIVEPHGRVDDDLDEAADSEDTGDEFDAQREREEWEDYRQSEKERQAFLEREHRLRLQQELGGNIDPDAYSPRQDAKAESLPGLDEEDEDAEAEPDAEEDDDDSLDERLTFILTLNEAGLWVIEHQRDDAISYYGEPTEDWHTLPEPPDERPSY